MLKYFLALLVFAIPLIASDFPYQISIGTLSQFKLNGHYDFRPFQANVKYYDKEVYSAFKYRHNNYWRINVGSKYNYSSSDSLFTNAHIPGSGIGLKFTPIPYFISASYFDSKAYITAGFTPTDFDKSDPLIKLSFLKETLDQNSDMSILGLSGTYQYIFSSKQGKRPLFDLKASVFAHDANQDNASISGLSSRVSLGIPIRFFKVFEHYASMSHYYVENDKAITHQNNTTYSNFYDQRMNTIRYSRSINTLSYDYSVTLNSKNSTYFIKTHYLYDPKTLLLKVGAKVYLEKNYGVQFQVVRGTATDVTFQFAVHYIGIIKAVDFL